MHFPIVPFVTGIALGAGGTIALTDSVRNTALLAAAVYVTFKVFK